MENSNYIMREITPLSDRDCFYIADRRKTEFTYPLNPQLHSRSATYIKRNGLLIRKITIKSSRPFQCAYHPLTP